MKNITQLCSILIVLLIGQFSIAQIEGDNVEQIEVEEKKSTEYTDRPIEVFALSNWSNTNRRLIENEGLYGDTLGQRRLEEGLNIWSFGIGIRSRITEHISWQGGISLTRNGESYNFEGTDSTYAYQTRYSYIGMPVKVNYVTGDKFRFIGGIGLIPQMFVRYSQDRQWTTTTNHQESELVKTNVGYNTVVLSGIISAGAQVRYSDRYIFSVIPEYRYQFNSSYVTKDSFKHFGRAFGVNISLSYLL